jgi:hypothetical protein
MKHLILLVLIVTTTGCNTFKKKPISPFQSVNPTGEIIQKGDSPNPGTVTTNKEQTNVSLPAGTTITFNEKLGTYTLNLPSATVLSRSGTTVEAKGPTAFTPPAPPTPSDEAEGKTVVYRWFLFSGALLLGGFLCYRGHIKGGVICVAGAIAYNIVQKFLSELTSNFVLCGFVLVGVSLFAAWHFMNDKQQAEVKSKLSELASDVTKTGS